MAEPVEVRIVEAMTVKPGDRVLLRIEDGIDASEAQRLKDALGDHFPGVHFVVIGGVDAIKIEAGAVVADTAPTPENVDGHALGPQFWHEDGRLCAWHNRLRIWVIDGATQCLREHPLASDRLKPPGDDGG